MSMTSSRPYIIRALYEWIVDNDCTPYLLVDTAVPGVDVPDQFANEEQVVLNLSPMAIREMSISGAAIVFLARFGGRTFQICVPVGAVMAIYAKENGEGMVFDVDEAQLEGEGEGVHQVDAEVNDDESSSKSDPDGSSGLSRPPKKRPSLRVVK